MTSVSQRVAEVVGLFQDASWSQTRLSSGEIVDDLVLNLQPFGGDDKVLIAQTLSVNKTFQIFEDGTLRAVEQQLSVSLPSTLIEAVRCMPAKKFRVLVRWEPGREHPVIFVLSPTIDTNPRTKNKHVLTKSAQRGQAVCICVYGPHLGAWNSANGEVWHLVLLIAAWLASYQIWEATGKWFGPEASHDLAYVRKLYRGSECWCGSGAPMRSCTAPVHSPVPEKQQIWNRQARRHS